MGVNKAFVRNCASEYGDTETNIAMAYGFSIATARSIVSYILLRYGGVHVGGATVTSPVGRAAFGVVADVRDPTTRVTSQERALLQRARWYGVPFTLVPALLAAGRLKYDATNQSSKGWGISGSVWTRIHTRTPLAMQARSSWGRAGW